MKKTNYSAAGPSSSRRRRVKALWDVENSGLPDGYDITKLRANIDAALQKFKPDLILEGKIIAIGPRGSRAQNLGVNLSNDFKFQEIPTENMECDTPACVNLVVHKNSSSQEQVMRKTDVADKFILKKMLLKYIDDDSYCFLIISGDGDFLISVAELRKRDAFIMLATHEHSIEKCRPFAKAVWLWESPRATDVTMVNGGQARKMGTGYVHL